MRVLYEVEFGHSSFADAIGGAVEQMDLPKELLEYMERLVRGVREQYEVLDVKIGAHLKGYDIDRLAALDRTILRIAAFEFFHVPEMPPAVTINEAIEIVKRYSTAESGRFVNGVLANLLLNSPKANWDPSTAPAEVMEAPPEVEAVEIEEVEVAPEDKSFQVASRIGGWKIRSDAPPDVE